MIAADASVAIAAAQPWHESHRAARAALRREPVRLPAHAAVESYSVLTRLPHPDRVSAPEAHSYLVRTFERPFLALPADGYEELLDAAAAKNVTGGAVYDALVGATAARAGARLLTLDRRAIRAYEAVGADFELLA